MKPKTLCEAFMVEEKLARGGARKGAGRKPTGKTKILANFYLSRTTVAELESVPRGQRSKFVEAAIIMALGRQ